MLTIVDQDIDACYNLVSMILIFLTLIPTKQIKQLIGN